MSHRSIRSALLEPNIYNMLERLEKVEEKIFKPKQRKAGTKSQKLLLFKELGLLDIINQLVPTQRKRALLLSFLIDADKDNIEDDLSQIYKSDSKLINAQNYDFLLQVYESLNLEKQAINAEKILVKLQSKKEAKK